MTYLFDIGNVLLSFDFEPALNSLMGNKPAANAYEQLIMKKDDFESGNMSVDDYVDLARNLLDFHGSDEHFFTTWNSIFTEISENFELARSLKKEGHRLILFSNTSPIHARYCMETYHLMEIFDEAVLSYEMNAIKPNDDFFTRAFEKYNIVPDQTIYIDDLPENIAAGRRFGLKSFCYDYNKHSELLTWLDAQ